MSDGAPDGPRPDRVLLLHDYGGDRGGAEHLALDFRRLLRERGIDAQLFASDADPWDDVSEPDIVVKGGGGARHTLREVWNADAGRRLAQVLEEFQPDIVQIVMFLTQLSPAVLPPLIDVPTVHSINTYRVVCPTGLRWRAGSGMCKLPAGITCARQGCITPWGLAPRLGQRILLQKWRGVIERTVSPSRIMAGILERHDWPVTDIIPHSVPSHTRRREMDALPTLAFAGRLVREKGVDWLLRGFALAALDLGNVRLLIIGDGPERSNLETLARRLQISTQVEFTGHLPRKDSQNLLESAWVQVVPSLWAEPFGLVAAEALARGTPVIASDAGGPAEIVDHGSTGWIVKTEDDTALAEAIRTGLVDRARCVSMGRRGVEIAARLYDERGWIEQYLDLYGQLLTSRRAVSDQ